MASIYKTDAKTKVICQSLTFGYMYDIEQGIVEENIMGAVLDGTDLTLEKLRALTRVQVNEIWEVVKKETYPELYNEDGSMREMDDVLGEDDKKKV